MLALCTHQKIHLSLVGRLTSALVVSAALMVPYDMWTTKTPSERMTKHHRISQSGGFPAGGCAATALVCRRVHGHGRVPEGAEEEGGSRGLLPGRCEATAWLCPLPWQPGRYSQRRLFVSQVPFCLIPTCSQEAQPAWQWLSAVLGIMDWQRTYLPI